MLHKAFLEIVKVSILFQDNAMILSANNNWFHFGFINDNAPHYHYAIQITVSMQKEFILHIENKSVTTSSILIKNNTEHHLESGKEILIILVNPVSSFGYSLLQSLGNHDWIDFNPQWLTKLQQEFVKFSKHQISVQDLNQTCGKILSSMQNNLKNNQVFPDKRILEAVRYLEQHPMEIVPVEEIASVCKISEGRFLHLFKDNTGITYRRFQLWNKLMLAGKHLLSGMNLTDSAHAAGFADSAHLSRTFRETFGVSAKNILK